MRRRLDIAASIVVTPELMFLDEPTTGLDPRSRNQVWDIIRALAASGTTVLLCTQYLDEADQLADRIAVIDHGKVIAEGTPAQPEGVRRRRRAARPAARPRPARRGARRSSPARSTPSRTSRPTPPPSRCASTTPSARAEAVAELSRAGLGLAGFSLAQPSLDEVFLALTGHPAEEDDDAGGGGGMSTSPRRPTRPQPTRRPRRHAARRAVLQRAPAPPWPALGRR